MAVRMKKVLKRLSVKELSSDGSEDLRSVSRGYKIACYESDLSQTVQEANNENSDSTDNTNPHDYDDDFSTVDDGDMIGTMYEAKKQSSAESWNKIRNQLRDCVIQHSYLPEGTNCIMCTNVAQFRCSLCGPLVYFCKSCFNENHSTVNVFHVPELWKDGMFVPIAMEERKINVLTHSCLSQHYVPITCIDEYGFEHKVLFNCCSCEELSVSLVRAHLWPATPSNPRMVFTFNLLDWAEALLLECQVSVQDMCKALYFKCPYNIYKRRDIYQMFIESCEEYRFMKHQLRQPNFLCERIDDGNVCPSCPKDESQSIILSMDALFGLPRKKEAGKSYRDPLYKQTYFVEQIDIDKYVEDMNADSMPSDCNSFMAGDPLRTNTRYKSLDETAVFGCSCRHEFPLLFFNLKHGERISYAMYMLMKLKEKYGENQKFCVLYDIACTLRRSIEKKGMSSIAETIEFAIPIFHCYGHKAECQLLYSPLRTNGIGMTDGEVMERLWSFLRRFSRMTKEMHPSHRVDVLTSALLYYALKTKNRLPRLLCLRLKRAEQVYSEAIKILDLHMDKYNVLEIDIEKWIELENEFITNKKLETPKQDDFNMEYFLVLQTYYNLLKKGEQFPVSDQHTVQGDLVWYNRKLSVLEKKLNVTQRWDQHHPCYVRCRISLGERESKRQKLNLQSAVQKRKFLLNMKAKYADGHKNAQRLFKQIRKQTKVVKEQLAKLNASVLLKDPKAEPIVIEEILSPDASFWVGNNTIEENAPISSETKHIIVNNYFLKIRSEEDINLIKEEMNNFLCYYESQKAFVMEQLMILQSTDDNNPNTLGSIHILKQYLRKITHHAEIAKQIMFPNADADCSSDDEEIYSDDEELLLCSDSETDD